ncbi:very short patch repair endonuclease [Gimesia chilikensis]|uniref:very short patch repair endonuclease n=1 Tax=Gimesia chilikensis TaxID=2605989 RepID=UPI001659C34C
MDVFSPEKRSEVMSKIGSKNTKPEILVRKVLHSLGMRFRLHRKDLAGTPDIVLPKYKTVVFVHGCFWHGHSCPKGQRPATNVEFWNSKIEKNIKNDSRVGRVLRSKGWHVFTIWECQTKDMDFLSKKLLRIKENG